MDDFARKPPEGRWPPGGGDEEALVRDLLEEAGPRRELRREDLEAITGAARFAWRRGQRRRSTRRTSWALAASLAALALGLGLIRWRLSPTPAEAPPALARVEAAVGTVTITQAGASDARPVAAGDPLPYGATVAATAGRVSLRLLGGATVRLDEGTRVRLAAVSSLDLERGAVYVDTGAGVEPDRAAGARRAIEIRTPLGTAHDIGTQFTLRLEDSSSLTVAVREGAVAVERAGRAYHAASGEQLVLHADGRSQSRPVDGHGPAWEWILSAAPSFAIEGRTLREFLTWVERETGWTIRFEDATLADTASRIVLHGQLPEMRPDQALASVLVGAGLESAIQDGLVVVRSNGA